MSYVEPVQVLVSIRAEGEEDALNKLAQNMPEGFEYQVNSVALSQESIDTLAATEAFANTTVH